MSLIKCRVIGTGTYGRAVPGTIVEVTAADYAAAPWALRSLDDEKRLAAEAQAVVEDAAAKQEEHEQGRAMYRAQFESSKQVAQMRADAEAEAALERAEAMRAATKPEEPKAEASPAPKAKK